MANTKTIRIVGVAPFNLYEHYRIGVKLAFMNSPTSGLYIKWPGTCTYKPNEFGGKTAMYDFEMGGIEAVSTPWLQAFVDDLKEIGGSVTEADINDLDGQEKITLTL